MIRPRGRAGMTLIEVQVALLVLGIGLAGICPMVVMQSRLLRKFESRGIGANNPQVVRGERIVDGAVYSPEGGDAPPPVTVLQPHPDAWARRIGTPAAFTNEAAPQTFPPILAERQVDVADDALSGPWADPGAASPSGGTSRTLAIGQGGSASWTFSAIPPGRYRVMAALDPRVAMADDATYTIGEGGPGVIAKKAPASEDGLWIDLGNHTLGETLVVRLASPSKGALVAGSVRVGARNVATVRPTTEADDPEPTGGARAWVRLGARP